ncbi:MAG: hypothetical protein IT438_12490 [Phycisphaerales bacterium]|nr:hypothetical protein [Phycisphaerales bacterium]
MNLLDLFYLPTAALTAPWWARKARGGWRERFGHTAALPRTTGDAPRLMLHAVSVGEVNTLRTLVPMLRDDGIEVVISATTDTGLARARALFAESELGTGNDGKPAVRVVRYPLDLSSPVKRFMDAVSPDAVALVELEIWPNFVAECAARGVPVAVINGRLSARSFKGYWRFRRFLSPSFARLAFAAVQDEGYAERFRSMGVAADRVHITGSMKWDAVAVSHGGAANVSAGAQRLAAELGIDRARPLVVAGSTALIGKGATCEEALLHRSVPAGVQLLCAPRKPEHYERAYASLGGSARCTRRSVQRRMPAGGAALEGMEATTGPVRDRFLLDTIGELHAAYELADIAVVGRSFGGMRGSDPIEPIALGKPTIIGPAYSNFEYIVGRFAAASAIRICEPEKLPGILGSLLDDRPERQRMVEAGHACILAERGASERHATMLKGLLRLPARAVSQSLHSAAAAPTQPVEVAAVP